METQSSFGTSAFFSQDSGASTCTLLLRAALTAYSQKGILHLVLLSQQGLVSTLPAKGRLAAAPREEKGGEEHDTSEPFLKNLFRVD